MAERERRLRHEEEDVSATERRAAGLLADAETQANRIVCSPFITQVYTDSAQ